MNEEEKALIVLEKIRENNPHTFFRDCDLSKRGMHFVLRFLKKNASREITAGEIANTLGVSTARIALLLKKMEARKLIVKTKSSGDARKTIVKPTQAGIDTIDEVKDVLCKKMAKIIEDVGEEDIETFIEIMGRIKKSIENHELKGSK